MAGPMSPAGPPRAVAVGRRRPAATVEVDRRRGAPRGRGTPAARRRAGRPHRRRGHVGGRRGGRHRQAGLRGDGGLGRARREPAEPAVVVVQALPKGDRGELAVEMLTEIGVARIVPWAASRCVAVWKGERAAKSLRGGARPRARPPSRPGGRGSPRSPSSAATAEVVGPARAAPTWPWCCTRTPPTPLAACRSRPAARIVVVVGPEGGLTDDEVAAFAAAGRAVRLGAEVLRTSTAGVAAVAALLARTPRWLTRVTLHRRERRRPVTC